MSTKYFTRAGHRHRVTRTDIRTFSGPVRQPENRAAHGNVCFWDHCDCGAIRKTNANAGQTEKGQWVAAQSISESRK